MARKTSKGVEKLLNTKAEKNSKLPRCLPTTGRGEAAGRL